MTRERYGGFHISAKLALARRGSSIAGGGGGSSRPDCACTLAFDAAFRVVAANLGISVVPAQVGGPLAAALGIRIIPLTDGWAKRSFAVCFRDFDALHLPARRMVEHMVEKARSG